MRYEPRATAQLRGGGSLRQLHPRRRGAVPRPAVAEPPDRRARAGSRRRAVPPRPRRQHADGRGRIAAAARAAHARRRRIGPPRTRRARRPRARTGAARRDSHPVHQPRRRGAQHVPRGASGHRTAPLGAGVAPTARRTRRRRARPRPDHHIGCRVRRAVHRDAAARRGARGDLIRPPHRRSPPATPSDSRTSRACRRSSSARPTTCAARRMPPSGRRTSRPTSCSRGRRWMRCCGSSSAASASRSSRRWCSSIAPDCGRSDSAGRRSTRTISVARPADVAPTAAVEVMQNTITASATAFAARAGATMRLAGASA